MNTKIKELENKLKNIYEKENNKGNVEGEWVKSGNDNSGRGGINVTYVCSNCGRKTGFPTGYCSKCGSKNAM